MTASANARLGTAPGSIGLKDRTEEDQECGEDLSDQGCGEELFAQWKQKGSEWVYWREQRKDLNKYFSDGVRT